jgi:hypothetical protein
MWRLGEHRERKPRARFSPADSSSAPRRTGSRHSAANSDTRSLPGALVYGLAGASFLNQDLNINFAAAASKNTTTPGLPAEPAQTFPVKAPCLK